MQVRTVAAASGAILVALATAGCNMLTPQATRIEYDASDGISAKTGQIGVHNVVLVGEPEGDALSLNVTFSNGADATTVEVRLDDQVQQLRVPSGITTFGFADQQLVFEGVKPEFGATRNVSFAADGAAPAGVPVQMISTEFAGYESLAPVEPEAPATAEVGEATDGEAGQAEQAEQQGAQQGAEQQGAEQQSTEQEGAQQESTEERVAEQTGTEP